MSVDHADVVSIPYQKIEGPEALRQYLENLLTLKPTDEKAHYILYLIGQQKSAIKIDTTQQPFQFWHQDTLGRPATNALKEVIDQFLKEKWHATIQTAFFDLFEKDKAAKLNATYTGEHLNHLPEDPIAAAFARLSQEKRKIPTESMGLFGLFASKKQEQESVTSSHQLERGKTGKPS